MNIIFNQMQRHFKHKVVLIGEYGSNNYGTTIDLSDKDLLAYVIPTTEDLYGGGLFYREHITFKVEGVEYDLTLKDIRYFVRDVLSGNSMLWEIMYNVVKESNNVAVLDGYLESMIKFSVNNSNILNYKQLKDIKSIAYNHRNYVLQTIDKDFKVEDLRKGSSIADYYLKYGYNTKGLSNVLRVNYMLEYMLSGKKISDSIYLEEDARNNIKGIKEGIILKEDVETFLNKYICTIDKKYKELKKIYKEDYIKNIGKFKEDLDSRCYSYLISNNYLKGYDSIKNRGL